MSEADVRTTLPLLDRRAGTTRRRVWMAWSLLGLLACAGHAQAQTIGAFVKVSERRVTRTVVEYTYRANLTAGSSALSGATATAVSVSPATTVVDGSLTFGPAAANGTTLSVDTFTFQHDRTGPFDWTVLQWTVDVTTPLNSPPDADAGLDRTVTVGQTVVLDGSASTDPDGDALAFAWTILSAPPGSAVALRDATAVRPFVVIDRPGQYELALVVNDGTIDSAPDTVALTTVNSPPVANAGPDLHVPLGGTAMLDGSASSDADGDPLRYEWTLVGVPPGSAATLSDPGAVAPTIVADVPGTYVIDLVVWDGVATSAPDTVLVATENVPPRADAGPDQSVHAGDVVLLDGAGSSDADGDALSFAWSLTVRPAGSAAALVNAGSLTASFVADLPGEYVAQLVVNDGSVDSAPDTATISTTNSTPVARAGDDLVVDVGQVVPLDGSASSDPDGDALTYSWSLLARPGGSAAALDAAGSAAPSFVADVAGDYVAQLIVNDGLVDSLPDAVLIRTADRSPIADAGLDRSVGIGAAVHLDGSGSSDPDGTPLGYSWTLASRPAGSASALAGSTTVTPTFVPDVPGTYVIDLVVDDGSLTSVPDSVTITAERPVVTIAASDADAAEAGADPGRVTVARTGDVGTPLTVALDFEGTATSGTDYVAIPPSVTIPAGASSLEIVVSPIDDTDFELGEGVHVRLLDDPAYLVGSPAVAIVTIADDDIRVLVGATDATADELGLDQATFTVTRLGPSAAPLDVSFVLAGTATEGADFAPLPRTVTIPAGAVTATVVVRPLDDDLFEGPETVILTVIPAPGYSVGTPDAATATILDDEQPVVTVTATDESAGEAGADTGTFTIARTGPTAAALTVSISTSGTATSGVDYQPLGTTVTIPAGAATVNVALVPIDDAEIEGAEAASLVIAPGAGYVVGLPGLATVVIADDDLPVVTVTATDPEATEAGPTTGTFTFTRTGDTSAELQLFVARGGSATGNADYTGLGGSNFFVTLPAGQSSATVTVSPLQDNVVDPAETVVLTINPTVSYVVGAQSSATVTITDDPPVVAVVASDASASEAGPDPGVFVLTRTGGNTAAALQVSYTVAGTATSSDYVSFGGSVTIPAGQGATTLVVTPRPDNNVEGPETVEVTLGGSAVYVPGAQNIATVTIADDPARVTITATDPLASEAGPDRGTFTVTRSGGDTAASLFVSISRDGTAQNAVDYQRLGGSSFLVVFPANEVSVTVDVLPLLDNLVESPETVAMTLIATQSYSVAGSGTATVTIADDPPVVNVVATDPEAFEAGADPGVFTFTRSGGNLSAALTVAFTRGGTAANLADYANVGASVVIPAGLTSATVTIVPVDDAVVEGPETVVVTISAGPTVVVGPQGSATVTIRDND